MQYIVTLFCVLIYIITQLLHRLLMIFYRLIGNGSEGVFAVFGGDIGTGTGGTPAMPETLQMYCSTTTPAEAPLSQASCQI